MEAWLWKGQKIIGQKHVEGEQMDPLADYRIQKWGFKHCTPKISKHLKNTKKMQRLPNGEDKKF